MSTPFVGDTLRVENLNISGFPKPTVVYSWLQDGETIPGANNSTYEVQTDDTGSSIGVKIVITNLYGQSTKVLSTDESGGVLELPSFVEEPFLNSANAIPPTEQQEIFVDNLVIRGEPTPSVGYKWYRSGALISGANSSAYTPLAADIGATLSAEITLTNIAGSAVTTLFADEPVQRASLSMSFVSIVSPAYAGRIAGTVTDAIGYDLLSYNWQANTGSNYFTFSTNPSTVEVPSEYLGFPIRCTLTAIRSGETDLVATSNPVTVSAVVGEVQGSFNPQGVLEPGTGYSENFVEKSTTIRSGNVDVFASESYPAFKLGFPEQYTMGADGFTLDMYAFHGAGIDSVTVSCDGGTGVTAGFEQSGGETGEGFYYIGVSADKFIAGGTFEIRATANPINGYSRSQKLLLTHATGENKISIDTSTTWRDAYDTLLETYDESKRNIIELTETGEYIIEGSSNAYRGFSFGWIEVIPTDGVVPTIDLSTGGINRSGEDDNIRPRMNALKVTNCVFKRLTVDETETNYDNGWYTEDFSDSRMWFHGCTFESDWFDTGSYNLVNNPPLLGFMRIGESEGKAISFENCYFDQTANGPIGAYLTKNVTCNKTVKDTYTNVKACINSRSTDKLNPANAALHADHYQLFTNQVTDGLYLMENYILYGYSGTDYDQKVQPFGFFGTGRETYRDIALVNSGWTGPSNNAALAQLGYTYDHVILNGVDLYKRSLGFPHGNQIGPVLVRGVNSIAGNSLKNSILHPLDLLPGASYGPGSTNEFRVQNSSPDFEFLGTPSSDSSLNLKYQWYIAGASMASVEFFAVYGLDPDGTNDRFYIGATAGGPSGPKGTTDVFKSNPTGRLGYWNEFQGGLRTFVLSNIRDLESANELVDQDWFMTVRTSKGSMTSKDFRRRQNSNVCDFNGFYNQIFNGVTMSSSDLINSASGVTIELRTPLDLVDRARWLEGPTGSHFGPAPGTTLSVSLGSFEGAPTPTTSYVWKKDIAGGSNYSVISGVTGQTLDLSQNGASAGTSLRCVATISNVGGSESRDINFGQVSDWNTRADGEYKFPASLGAGYQDLQIINSSVEFPGVTQASLVDTTHDFRIKSSSTITGKLYAAVWDGSAWSTYQSWNASGEEQRFLDLLGPGGAPSANETLLLYRDDPGDPTQFTAFPPDPVFGTFSDLKAILESSTGVVDLGGSTYEAEINDFNPDDVFERIPRVNGREITELKNGTIIGGRRATWTDLFGNSAISGDTPNIPTVQIGSGWSGPTFDIDTQGTSGDRGFNSKSIAYWDMPQWMELETTTTFGVLAFHISGISRVDVSVNNGPVSSITERSINPSTGHEAFCFNIDPSGVPAGTEFEIRAVAVPVVGVPRVLQEDLVERQPDRHSSALVAYCKFADVDRHEFYISPTGSDASGVSGGTADPFATVYKAMRFIKTNLGGNTANAVDIFMEPGGYTWGVPSGQNSSVAAVDKAWLTIQPVVGATLGDVKFTSSFSQSSGSGELNAGHIRLKNIETNQGPTGDGHWTIGQGSGVSAGWWFDNCILDGQNRYSGSVTKIYTGDYFHCSVTDSTVQNVARPTTKADLVRNCQILTTSEDIFSKTRVALGCSIFDNNRGDTSFHNDFIQLTSSAGGLENYIFQDLVALKQASAFLRIQESYIKETETDPEVLKPLNDIAIVNVLWVADESGSSNSSMNGKASGKRHILVDNSTIVGTAFNLSQDSSELPDGAHDFVVRNSVFTKLGFNSDDFNSGKHLAENNHYIEDTEQFQWGTNFSNGDPGFVNGWTLADSSLDGEYKNFRPTAGSTLSNRMNRFLNKDALSTDRLTSTAIGALETNVFGVYETILTSAEKTQFTISPTFYLYDTNAGSTQSGLALFPEGPTGMAPRNTLGYHTNFYYTISLERDQTDNRGVAYTHGRDLTLASGLGLSDDAFPDSSTVYIGNGTNESTALAKATVWRFKNESASTPNPIINCREVYFRNNTSEEFVADRREHGSFDQATYNTFNAGDTITNQAGDAVVTVESASNIDVLYGLMYGFKNTHDETQTEIRSLFSSDEDVSFAISSKTGTNRMYTAPVENYSHSTGIFEFPLEITPEYGGYFTYALTGIPEIINQCSYPCYTFDVTNGKILYKPETGNANNTYIPNVPFALSFSGISPDEKEAGVSIPTTKLTNIHVIGCNEGAKIRDDGVRSSAPGALQKSSANLLNMVLDGCSFRWVFEAARLNGESTTHLKNCVFKDMAYRGFSTLIPGSTVERCIFDNTQASSALYATFAGNTNDVQGRITIKDNIFQLPTTNHGQPHSLYEASYLHFLGEHNIYYNCQRTASAQLGSFNNDTPIGQTYEWSNNLSVSDNFVDRLDNGGQVGHAFQGGDATSNMENGEMDIIFRSNTLFVDSSVANPRGLTLFKQTQIGLPKDVKANVFYLNNMAFHGIGGSVRELEESNGDGIAHGYANNYSDGGALENTNQFGIAFGSSDVRLPAGLTTGDIFEASTNQMKGPLGTAATDGGSLGVRWNPIPTITQIREILQTENTDWADTYPALPIPTSPNSHDSEISGEYSRAFGNEDNRPGAFTTFRSLPVGLTVEVSRIGSTDLSIFTAPGDEQEYEVLFRIGDELSPVLTMLKGTSYSFDQSHISNRGYPLEIAASIDGATGAFTTGFSYTGTAGFTGAKAVFNPPSDSPTILHYFSPGGPEMGAPIGITGS